MTRIGLSRSGGMRVPSPRLFPSPACVLALLFVHGLAVSPGDAAAQAGGREAPLRGAPPAAVPAQTNAGPSGQATGDLPVRAEALLGVLRDSLGIWKGLPESVRARKTRALLEPIGLEDVRTLCRACAVDKGAGQLAKSVMQVKLYGASFSVPELSAMIGDTSMGSTCHEVLVRHVGEHQKTYGPADSEVLSAALLKLADTAGYPEGIRNQLEIASASLSRKDELLERMENYAASSSEQLVTQAARMMSASRDPRAIDRLLALLQRHVREQRALPGKVLIECGRILGVKVFDPISTFLSIVRDPEERPGVLQALAYTGDPRAMGVILREYDDSLSGIRDRTSRDTPQDERSRYFWLWHCTRLLEPVLTGALTGTSAPLRLEAVELLDRASRYGAMNDYPAVREGLDAAAATEPSFLQRVTEIQGRFDVWEAEKDDR